MLLQVLGRDVWSRDDPFVFLDNLGKRGVLSPYEGRIEIRLIDNEHFGDFVSEKDVRRHFGKAGWDGFDD